MSNPPNDTPPLTETERLDLELAGTGPGFDYTPTAEIHRALLRIDHVEARLEATLDLLTEWDRWWCAERTGSPINETRALLDGEQPVRAPDPATVTCILADPDCEAPYPAHPTPCDLGTCTHACGCVSST